MDTEADEARRIIADNVERLLHHSPAPGLAVEVAASIADLVRIDRRLADPDVDTLIAVDPLELEAAVWRRDLLTRMWRPAEHLVGDETLVDLGPGLPSFELGELYDVPSPDEYSPEFDDCLERLAEEGEADLERGEYVDLHSPEELSAFLKWTGQHASAEERRRVSGPGLRTFLNIADLWGLIDAERQRVLGVDPATYADWAAQARAQAPLELESDVLLRVSAALGIHRGLRTLYPTDTEGVGWLRKPNVMPPFGGQAPVELVIGGRLEALLATLRFLNGAEQGLFMPPLPEVDGDFRPYTDVTVKGDDGG
ncbi:antitoxin Xre-like helix-turn-helix domain-containing protein [Belnapia sp. F-4-1]|uniref:antitoxin Xre-like helix-turn-helix domain-containing protein n=1 Tax=Belnapia sp. F-4-1 TaxID=1545443 RepID=UPI00068937A0|nr:antitoxin Xre-like helix-turn-helix domain-containing protein [Belnapia sp. F-4-1]